jgi:hypothetical protein
MDEFVFIGRPPFRQMIPDHDEVHISCIFTWDRTECESLSEAWQDVTDKPVKLGGVAYGSSCKDFIPGLYIRDEITFTSRGCDNCCPWCVVPKMEGVLRELPITPGRWVQDNNFLQTSRTHKEKVFDMLRSQQRICFKGGLDSRLVDDHFVRAIQGLHIEELWTACDTSAAIPQSVDAIRRLARAGFSRHKIYCYVLIGDDMDENEDRCRAIYTAGAMPRAQLYRDFSEQKTEYSKEWRNFERMWQRPPATVAHMERGTDFREI